MSTNTDSARSTNTPEYWQAHLQRIEDEGISTRAYARREALSAASLYYWRSQFKRQAERLRPAQPSAAGPFVALSLTDPYPPHEQPSAASSANCCLILPAGMRLHLAALPHPHWLAQLGRHLQSEVH